MRVFNVRPKNFAQDVLRIFRANVRRAIRENEKLLKDKAR